MSKALDIMKSMASAEKAEEPVQPVEPVVETQPAETQPIETQPAETPVEPEDKKAVEEVVEVVASEEEKKENPTEEVPDGEQPQEGKEPESKEEVKEETLNLDNIEAWDEGESVEGDTTPDVNFQELGKDLGVDDVKSRDEFISKFNEKVSSLEQKVEELSEMAIPEDLPEQLREAIEMSKEGGDYLSYLQVNSVNYDAIGDVDLLANSIAGYFEKDGAVDSEALEVHLDSLTDDQIRIEAAKIRENGKKHQENQKNAMIAKVREKKEKITNEVSGALSRFENFSGFKVLPHQKAFLKSSFDKDQAIQAIMYTNGQFDADKAVRSLFRVKYGEQMDNYLKTKIKNQTKKEIIENVSNVEVQRPSSPPAVAPEEPKSALDNWVNRLKHSSAK